MKQVAQSVLEWVPFKELNYLPCCPKMAGLGRTGYRT